MNTQEFYKSKRWQKVRKVIINERTGDDGYVHCAICNKPILKPYDLIVHHKEELTDNNVDDAMVALNPDKVECVHFKCHNLIHERFGGNITSEARSYKKHVYIVYGAPCSGKTTWVHENATENDLIVDLDSIWQMISINERYEKPGSLKAVVFDIRDKLYDIIKYRSGKWRDAYIITGGALYGDRDRLKARVAADDLIFIDTPKDECVRRASSRHGHADEWIKYVFDWFENYQPEVENDL